MARHRFIAYLIALLVVAVGVYGIVRVVHHFGEKQGCTAAENAGPNPIVAFGDSITYGTGASRNCVDAVGSGNDIDAHVPGAADTTYPGVATRRLGRAVLDYGLPGERTGEGTQRFSEVLHETNAGTIVLLEGINDYVGDGTAPLVIAANLQDMIQSAQSAHARVILMTLTPVSPEFAAANPGTQATIRQLNDNLRALARQLDIPLIDLNAAFARAGGAALLSDGLHPNDRGYAVMGRAVAEALRSAH